MNRYDSYDNFLKDSIEIINDFVKKKNIRIECDGLIVKNIKSGIFYSLISNNSKVPIVSFRIIEKDDFYEIDLSRGKTNYPFYFKNEILYLNQISRFERVNRDLNRYSGPLQKSLPKYLELIWNDDKLWAVTCGWQESETI